MTAGKMFEKGSGGGEMKYLFHTNNIIDSVEMIAKAIPIVMEVLEKFTENRRRELKANRFYSGSIILETSFRYMGIRVGNNGMDLEHGEVCFVYYTDKASEEISEELTILEKSIRKACIS